MNLVSRGGLIRLSSLRVVYIDCDSSLPPVQSRQLSTNHALQSVVDVDAALTLIRAGAVDCVILDQDRPEPHQASALQELSGFDDPPPVIRVTDRDNSSLAVAALKAGAADYVLKHPAGSFVDRLNVAIRQAVESATSKQQQVRAEVPARNRLEALAAERQVLLRETNHRVGNSLQLVAAFLHLQASSSGPEARTVLGEANRRVMAVAQVHRKLHASDHPNAVAICDYLEALVEDILQTAAPDGGISPVSFTAKQRIEVDPDNAMAIGIVVTELLNQALREAAEGRPGPVEILLRRESEVRSTLTVVRQVAFATGPDVPPQPDTATYIIRAMTNKLASSITYDTGETAIRASFSFPTLRDDAAGPTSQS